MKKSIFLFKMKHNSKLCLYWIVTKSISSKYSFDIVLFLLAITIVYLIKFTTIRIPLLIKINDDIINEIIYFICSTYSVTFMALLVNNIFKEWKKYKDMYPHIKAILRRTLSVYSSRVSFLMDEFKNIEADKVFNFENHDFEKLLSTYKSDGITNFCRCNYMTAGQIYYDMEALMKFSDCIDSKMLSIIYYISTNLFVLKHKDKEHENLSLYSIYYEYERELYKHYQELKRLSVKIFGDEFLPKYMPY